MTKIFLYTSIYPFGEVAESFVYDEAKEAIRNGFDLTIVPVKKAAHVRDLPTGVHLDKSICDMDLITRVRAFLYIFSLKRLNYFFREETIFSKICVLKDIIKYLYAANLVYIDLKKKGKVQDSCVFYSYWMSYPPIAFAYYKTKHPQTKHKFISRGHASDIYIKEDIYYPLRNYVVGSIDLVCVISNYGKEYLQSLYKNNREKFELFRLGVKDNYIEKKETADNRRIEIVSCSTIIDRKRVDLVFKSLNKYADNHSNIQIHWTHIGDGILRSDLEEEIRRSDLSSNFTIELKGNLENHEILSLYKNNKYHCHILLSKQEGIPVALMEAIASGIPILATDVDGVSEIANDETGALLSVNFKQEEFNYALDEILNNNNALSISAYNYFKLNYDEKTNYNQFFTRIKQLIN